MNQRLPIICLSLWGLVLSCGGGDDDGSGGQGAGGSAATGAPGGATGLGGSAAAGGSEQAAGGSASTAIPRPSGTIGSGAVECFGIASGSCPAGQACCASFPFGDNTCVTALADCPSFPFGCDDPEDCPGARCCATLDNAAGVGEFSGTSCKAECDAERDVIVCTLDTDCPMSGTECAQSSQQVRRCF